MTRCHVTPQNCVFFLGGGSFLEGSRVPIGRAIGTLCRGITIVAPLLTQRQQQQQQQQQQNIRPAAAEGKANKPNRLKLGFQAQTARAIIKLPKP